jgi:NAD(P)-dependent dehydrogenase (short-subunit alcohol dehydrogenase family)
MNSPSKNGGVCPRKSVGPVAAHVAGTSRHAGAWSRLDGSSIYGASKAAPNRLTVAAAGQNEGLGIAVNALTPHIAILTRLVVAGPIVSNYDVCEPVETMGEAALAPCTGDPNVLTGRIAYSLRPADLAERMRVRETFHAGNGWPNAFEFRRVHTPYPTS